MNSILNIGVLGCAQIADRCLVPAMLGLPDLFSIRGVASRSAENAKAFAAKHGLPVFIGYGQLLESAELDAVYIPLPNGLHEEWIEKALNRGLHVLVEKSLACSPEAVERLCNLAESKGLALVENFQFRFHRQLGVIQDILASGRLGELRCLRSSFGFPPFPDESNIRYDKALGGGSLLDAGAYPLKISQVFLGGDLEVAAANLWFDDKRGVDIWGGAYLRQKDGALFSEIAFGFDHQYQCSLELWGSKGRLATNRIFTAPPGYSPELSIECGSDKEVIQIEPDNHFEAMLRYFHMLANGKADHQHEYMQNKNQARLIAQVFDHA